MRSIIKVIKLASNSLTAEMERILKSYLFHGRGRCFVFSQHEKSTEIQEIHHLMHFRWFTTHTHQTISILFFRMVFFPPT